MDQVQYYPVELHSLNRFFIFVGGWAWRAEGEKLRREEREGGRSAKGGRKLQVSLCMTQPPPPPRSSSVRTKQSLAFISCSLHHVMFGGLGPGMNDPFFIYLSIGEIMGLAVHTCTSTIRAIRDNMGMADTFFRFLSSPQCAPPKKEILSRFVSSSTQ